MMRIWPFRASSDTGRDRSRETPASAAGQQFLIVCHSGDDQGQAILDNLCVAFDFAKIRFTILDLRRTTAWPPLHTFGAVVICTETIWQWQEDKAARLRDYVHGGGGLMIAYRGWNEHLASMFGAREGLPEPGMHLTSGLRFETDMVPGAAGLTIDDTDWLFEHSRFAIEPGDLTPDCTVQVSDLGGRPIVWTRAFGAGRLAYWNTGVLFCRALRGFVVHSLLGTMQTGVCAIAGFAMFHIDDFPTSLSDAKLEPVATEFPGLDRDGFFFDVWHRDMMALRQKHGLAYTWYTVMNYDDVETGPGADPDASAAASGRDILRDRFARISVSPAAGDEYGFHGYNHEPLVADTWPDAETLGTKLTMARALWQSTVPAPMPTSWVPANNWYDAKNVRVLKRVFPEVSTVCSLYSSGDPELGEYREFGPEPWDPGLLCLPRETYGYVQAPELKMMMLSQIAAMGVWTHFVHPDDVYDIPAAPGETITRRNPYALGWRAPGEDGTPSLFDQFDDWIACVRRTYPWLDFVTTSKAEQRYRTHVETRVEVATSQETIRIDCDHDGLFYVRMPAGRSLVAGEGGAVVDERQVDGGVLHVVRCSAGRATFSLRDG